MFLVNVVNIIVVVIVVTLVFSIIFLRFALPKIKAFRVAKKTGDNNDSKRDFS